MQRILRGMMNTMNSVKPPRMTALRELHEAETGGPFSILIGTILSLELKMKVQQRSSKFYFQNTRTQKHWQTPKSRMLKNHQTNWILSCKIQKNN